MCHRQKWLTNASLRERFGLGDDKVALVSRIIRDALDAKWIKAADSDRPKSGYLPYWG
jgi:ATP-dependent DNA helicase RecG